MKQKPQNKVYNHLKIEKSIQSDWEKSHIYKTENTSKKKPFYVLDMFPYPSGAGLHVGHPRGYIGSDVFARFKRMQGYNVLHPMGFDAFGLPAEQYAIQTGKHPSIITNQAIKNFKKQLGQIGFSYDWSREIQTIDPEYYKWTQYIFLQIYNSFFDTKKQTSRHIDELVKIFEKEGNSKANEYTSHGIVSVFSKTDWKNFSSKERQDILMQYRLAYEGYAEVNWCAQLGTVLANDEILDKGGTLVSERGDFPVEKKSMRQWFMRISAYGDRLISGLDTVDFAESTKEIQRNWIGRSEGSEIDFKINTPKQKILIGTRNEAKFRMTVESFPKDIFVEFISLNDIDVDDSSLAEGQDFEENARIKSEFYFKKTGIPTIALDNVLWIKKWPKDNGVMIHMRKEANPQSSRATDEEVICFFQNWLDSVGGESEARFKYALAYTNENGTDYFSSTQRKYILQKKQGKNFWAGYPTEALLIDAKTGEYKGDQDNSVRYDAFIKDLDVYSGKWFKQKDKKITVFTTRADTLFGVTYVVLAPEHVLVHELLSECENRKEVEKYIETVKNKTQEERTENKVKTGVELKGVYAVNPANGEQIPVWIADYVLASYGTGAVMAVPAHDERDFEFAKKYNLTVKYVIEPLFIKEGGSDGIKKNLPFFERNAVVCVIEHWSEEKFLCLAWKINDWKGFVVGGIEVGEDIISTGEREIKEETGYQNLEYVKKLDYKIHSQFFHEIKNQNRFAHFDVLYFKLKNKEQIELTEEEKKLHDLVWVEKNKIDSYVSSDEDMQFIWKAFQQGQFFGGKGILVNSGKFNSLNSDQAKKEITEFVGGKLVTKYKMRDAIFARQRYWGEPIPLIHDKKTGLVKEIPLSKLPLVLPNVKSYKPTGTGDSPLAGVKSWNDAGYETNTMPGWAGSSWYFLRYMDPQNKKALVGEKAISYWKNIDMYIGGTEHNTGHLMYARFWHKVLFDLGIAKTQEPFKALRHQGMIGGADGRKMSKRWGNVVNPDDVVKTYGADTLRVFEMFLGPFEAHLPWSEDGIIGSRRFVERVWRLSYKACLRRQIESNKVINPNTQYSKFETTLHKTIKKVTEDIASFNFNTAISSMMICLNEMEKLDLIEQNDFKKFLQILSPFAVHITDVLWKELGEKESIHISKWPTYDESKLLSTTSNIAVQINGKMRGLLVVSTDIKQEELQSIVLADSRFDLYLKDKEIKKVIYITGKLISFVV